MRIGLVVGVLLGIGAGTAAADGERSPLFGFTVLGTDTARTPDQHADLGGVGVDLAWWRGPVGIAGEASQLWSVDGEGSRAFVAGGSLRLRVYDALVPSLLDPRDVDLGIELQAIAEHAWWDGAANTAAPTAYGVGIALRLRGSGDLPGSTLIAESRVFVRVMASSWSQLDTAASARVVTAPVAGGVMDRPVTIVFGFGGSWGSGTHAYTDALQMHLDRHDDVPLLVP
jgi:hypothetical protein